MLNIVSLFSLVVTFRFHQLVDVLLVLLLV